MNESQSAILVSGAPSIDGATVVRVAKRSIFFAHQSVGFNILDGVADIIAGVSGKTLEIVESTDIADVEGLYHSRVGQNGDPMSKIEGFVGLVRDGVGNNADVSFFKMCYVDFRPETNVETVFDKYRETMSKLQESYPKTRFVHVTVPLTAREQGLKTTVKRIMGRTRRGYEDNLVRERFNRMIREEYASNGLVFDLARVESTLPDGKRLQFQDNGETYCALAPEYTTDGGHLNELGRRHAAAELLRFLGSLE